jgi:hypothetical protein
VAVQSGQLYVASLRWVPLEVANQVGIPRRRDRPSCRRLSIASAGFANAPGSKAFQKLSSPKGHRWDALLQRTKRGVIGYPALKSLIRTLHDY